MMDHLSLYKGFGSFLILAFTSSSARCSTTRVILAMIFSLSLRGYLVRENHITGGKVVLVSQHRPPQRWTYNTLLLDWFLFVPGRLFDQTHHRYHSSFPGYLFRCSFLVLAQSI